MRIENLKNKCFVCGADRGFASGNKCENCGASFNESAMAHLLVRYSGGEYASIPESTELLKYKSILTVDASAPLEKALENNLLYTAASHQDIEKTDRPGETPEYERILVNGPIGPDLAEALNRLLAENGIVISVQDPCMKKHLGNENTWQMNGGSFAVYHKKDNTDIGFSGERFIPGIEDQKLETEHLQRYMSARCLVKGMKVLDIACGEGYGSALLAETADQVLGMDIDQETVDRAQKKYKKENLSFRQGDAARISLEDASVDAVVSFETIEHIDEALQHQFLKEIDRILKPDGILIMSTPNKAVYSDRYHYFNEFHIHEFYHDEFRAFLGKYFPHILIYQQSFQVVSLLSACDGQTEDTVWYGNPIDQAEAKYYIAVASRKEIHLPDMTSMFVQKSGEHEENIQRIVSLQNEEVLRNLHIQKLDGELAEKGALIQQLQEEEGERNIHIRELDKELETLGKRIQTLQDEQAERDAHLRELDKELETRGKRIQTLQDEQAERDAHLRELDDELEKNGKLIRTYQEEEEKRNQHIKKLDAEIDRINQENQDYQKENQQLADSNASLQALCAQTKAERDHMEEQRNSLVKERDELKGYFENLQSKVEELNTEINNKQGHINLLLESDRELQRIHHSRSWKVLTAWWRVRDFMVPQNSRRRLFLKLIGKFIRHPIWCLKRVDRDHIRKFNDGLRNGSILSTSQRLDNYLGGGTEGAQRPDQLPLVEYAGIGDVPRLHVPSAAHPDVSIVIPVYNQFAYTYACLKSIAKNSGDVSYEVIIADDCSTDLTQDIQKAISGIRVVRNKENLRFLLNCNHAAKKAKGKYILFLNNDTQVMQNWLQPLITLIERDEKIGMVGSKLIYPDGRLQEAGGILWKDGSAWNYGHLDDPTKPEYNYVKETDYISGAAIMIRADLWKKLGGFDEHFAPAYYEDTDLAFAVRKEGYKVLFQPLSVVIHFEGVSNGTDTGSGLKAYQVENQKKFYEKWKETLEKDHYPNGQNVFRAKDRGQFRKQLLVVDHYVPHYDKDAGGRCTYMYLKLFVKMGFKVTFIGDNFFPHEPYTTELEQMGIEVLYGNYYYANWQSWLKENGKAFDYIYLQRPHISIKYIDLVKAYSDAKVIYFAHDLHHIREKREYEITGDEKLLKSAEEWKKIEYKLFGAADVGHVVGSYEQGIMQAAFPDKPIRNIPLYLYESLPENIEKNFSKRHDLLYVGGFNHHPNEDAVLWFAKEVYPKILTKYPDMVWHLVGGHLTKEIEDLANEHIIIHGFVSDEELERMYRTCRMAVVPLRYGAGVKGKVIEASYYQIPLVTTPIGAEGISMEEESMVVETDPDKMAKVICDLYGDQKRLKTLSDNCEKLIRNHYMLDEAERIIRLDFVP